MTPDELESLFGLGILGGPPQLLVGVNVVLLGELQVPQEFWVHLEKKETRLRGWTKPFDTKKARNDDAQRKNSCLLNA